MTIDEGNIGNLISGGNFFASVEQIIYNRDVVIAKEFDKGTIERFLDIHIETTASATARTILREQSAVALIGPPGCGRRTTGVVLLASLDVKPRSVVLDLEDLNRPLGVLPRHGYLLDFDEVHDQLTAKAGLWLQDLVARVRDVGSYLIVRARSQSWRTLELDDYTLRTVSLTAPPAITVFQSHLKNMASPAVASRWVQYDSIVDQLAQAEPAEGVRLAQIAQDVIAAGTPDPQQVGEAIAAYKNWTDVLVSWFGDTTATDKGYSRALLLATAALDGAPATTIFTAAGRLASLVELPRDPGGVLVGPDVKTLVSDTKAELQGQYVRFTRPGYAPAVLDYVWRERPHMHDVLRTWLINLPDPSDSDSGRAAGSLTELAIRQGDGNLICSAAIQWASQGMALRELGVGALTAAAMSPQVGRQVRRQLYRWARAEKAANELHLVVAEVCGGELARAYPQIALTRLRHLSNRTSLNVQTAVLDNVDRLSQDPTLRYDVLAEISAWVEDDREPRRSVGRNAFLRLARRDETGQIGILAPADRDLDLLAGLWRDALRHGESADAVAQIAFGWFDAAIQDSAPREAVIEIFARTCRTSIDLSALTRVVIGWPSNVQESVVRIRDDFATELLGRAYQRDPIIVATTQLGTDGS